jgi:MFS family permease
MFVVNLASTLLVLCIWLPLHSSASIIVFSALYGFTSGAFVSLMPALVAQISPIREIGVRNGSVFAVISVAALTGSPIGGALIDRDGGGFVYLQVFCGVTMAVGCAGYLAARVWQAGWKWKVI